MTRRLLLLVLGAEQASTSYLATTDHVATGITAQGMAFLLGLAITALGVLGFLIIRKSQRYEDEANERTEAMAQESQRREERAEKKAEMLATVGMKMAQEGNEVKAVLLKMAERMEALEGQQLEHTRELERVDQTLKDRVKGFKGGT
jgi:hypothetical protein